MADLTPGTNIFNSFSGNSQNNPPINGAGAPAQKQNKNQIITSLYRTILGREPDSNALMYYISQPEINEDLVRKQMIESEEHKNILEEYKKISLLKKEIEDLNSGEKSKEKFHKDKELEIEELNKILHHKSEEITKLKNELAASSKQTENKNVRAPSSSQDSTRYNFIQKIIRILLIK